MSEWWWLPLAIGAVGAGALSLVARHLRAEAAALLVASELVRRVAAHDGQ